MRRTLLGGLGLALGLGAFAPPAAGQDARAPQPQRAARLGRPIAVPESGSGDATVTPAGLLSPRQGGTTVPTPMPAAPVGVPVGGMPMGGVPMGGVPVGQPRPGGVPSVVEDRGPGAPPTTFGPPTVLSGVPVVVPSVVPDGGMAGLPGLDSPLPVEVPGAEAVGRVVGASKWWTSADYLMWWSKSAETPPLVTTSSVADNGQLGRPTTQVLLGGGAYGETFHSGIRTSIGRWFGCDQVRGVEGRIFYVAQASETFSASTAQYGLLARPFYNVNPNTNVFPNTANFGSTSQVIVDPSAGTGGISVELENMFWGAEANYRRRLLAGPSGRLDAIVGYRYLHMHEELTITENFARTPTNGSSYTSGVVTDQFRTTNDFHGGQIGLVGELRRGRWVLDGRATVAFGNLTQTVQIGGSQQLVRADGSVVNANGGLLAVPGANTGKFTENVFTVIPEVGVNIGYQLTSRLRLFVGYNFIYFGNACRAPGAIDPNIDAARVPNFLTNPVAPVAGTPRPQPRFDSSGTFIQGINFGLQFTW